MKHLIWSSTINLDDWKDFLENSNIDADDIDGAYAAIIDLNYEYLMDEKGNLDITVPEGLVVYADLGRWDGHSTGIVQTADNIADCLVSKSYWQDMDIFVNEENDLIIVGYHHDGTDYYTVRKWRSAEIGKLMIDKLDAVEIRPIGAYEYTEPVGDIIKKVYGWT